MSMIMQSGINIAVMAQAFVELSSIGSVQVRGDAVQMPCPRYGGAYDHITHSIIPD